LWQDYFSVRVKEIDEQHKQIFGLVNELYDGYINHLPSSKICDILDRLIRVAVVHFNTEESYFAKYKYDNLREHSLAHSTVLKQLRDFKFEYLKNPSTLSLRVFYTLREWLNRHMMQDDQLYVDCLTSKGVAAKPMKIF